MNTAVHDILFDAICLNDWDEISTFMGIIKSDPLLSFNVIHWSVFYENIALTHLFAKLPHVNRTGVLEVAVDYCQYWMCQVIFKLGFETIQEESIMKLLRTVKALDGIDDPGHVQFVQWALKKCDPPPSSEFIRWFRDDFLANSYYRNNEVVRHFVYRSLYIGYLDGETITRMESVLVQAEEFNLLPRELIREICLYLFICSPPPPSSQ